MTEIRELQAKLAALALRDPLTGLANRRLLDDADESVTEVLRPYPCTAHGNRGRNPGPS